MNVWRRPTSLTICNAIAKYAKHTIREKHSRVSFRKQLEYPDMQREILNIRCEKRVSRDLLQDLQDIREGITVTHASDLKKVAAAQKRERKNKRQQAKTRKHEKVNIQKWLAWLQDDNVSDALKHHADGTKYIWFSSATKEQGVLYRSPVNFAGNPHSEVVYLTE